ncbi:MAG TPA: DNA polymerase Y family protein [Burkholderiaceae bacterium]|nr:DNA polymerase Y family protein [Burkholderiaceae bacterium]
MSLWLALCLPALPLQLAERAIQCAGPLAITEGPRERPLIAFCNNPARAAGIAPAMKLAAAQALAHGLAVVPRNPDHERDALHELACWAYQYSALITIRTGASSSGLVLETGGSERLFGGRSELHRRIRHGLESLGYRAAFGTAATAAAAWLIGTARASGLPARDAQADGQLQSALASLPLTTLEWDADSTRTLHALGLDTIGQVLGLPRDAFARRFGADRLDQLDRALGLQPDPQPAFCPPARFAARIELPADVMQSGQLMFPAHRLLRSLEGFLRGHGAGAAELVFTVHHNPRGAQPVTATRITLALAAPERDAGRLAKLLAERLTRVSLPEPAVELSLAVERMAPFQALNASLLPPSQDSIHDGLDWLQLTETLHARLGSERVFQLQAVDDHRPEHATRIVPLAAERDSRRVPIRPASTPQRPLLILAAPQPLPQQHELPDYRGELELVAGPERIEAGWWDFGDPHRPTVHRDYFVARNRLGQMLWIYRELKQPRGWYLHGFFC